MPVSRRLFLALAGAQWTAGAARAARMPLPLQIAVRSRWQASQVALTKDNLLFLGLPRPGPDRRVPSLVRREADGALKPFPGNAWNDWKPGNDSRHTFVYLNAVHIFGDDTVWCVDQGVPAGNMSLAAGIFPAVGAQKLIQLDPISGDVLRVLRFNESILPRGALMNDLRQYDTTLYITDSGLGGLIVHDLATGTTVRRLSGNKSVMASDTPVPSFLNHVRGGKTFIPPNSDMIEVSADGKWLYWASPTGPFRRIETRFLRDPYLSDMALAACVEHVFDNMFASGCAMDDRGNLYIAETATGHLRILAPSGQTAILASDQTLIRPDGCFISRDRRLYIPVKRPIDTSDAPFDVYSCMLPREFDGIVLGGPITGLPIF